MPFTTQFGTTPDSLVPNDGEIGFGTEIVRNGDGRVQVQHNMPISTGHEYSLSWVLNELNLFKEVIWVSLSISLS